MKNALFTLCFIFTLSGAFSQPEKAVDKIVSAKLIRFYNANEPDSIFAMYSEELAKAFPLTNTKAFFQNSVNPLGKILKAKMELRKQITRPSKAIK